jgi:hypothetical protein
MHHKSTKQLEKEAKITAWSTVNPGAFRKVGITKKKATEYEAEFQGDLVWPWETAYNQDRKQFDPAFDEFPNLIAYCRSLDDIAWCLSRAKEWGWKVTCRSGGHNTAGYSVITGTMTIDMSRYFSYVHIDPTNRRAVVGSGTNFDLLDDKLNDYGMHVPGGECGDVCVGGYSQGGGYGFTSRQFGMNCDNIVEAKVMTIDRQGVPHVVIANASQNRDLLWALCGGTGNNYGVLVELTYKLHPAGQMWGATLKWANPDDMLKAALMVQNQYTKKAPPELGFLGVIMIQVKDTAPSFQVSFIYNGPAAKGAALLAPLAQIGKPEYKTYSGTFRDLNNILLPDPNFPPGVTFANANEVRESRYISDPIDEQGWQKIIQYYLDNRQSWNITNALFIEYYGGAINMSRPYPNAFVHRNVYMDFYADSFWFKDAQKTGAENWLDGYISLLDGYSNGEQYQNYPRRNTPNYQWAFWKEAIYSLAPIKQKYDPLGLQDFPMSATLPKDRNDPVYLKVKRADQKSRFPKSKLVYDPAYESQKKRRKANRPPSK